MTKKRRRAIVQSGYTYVGQELNAVMGVLLAVRRGRAWLTVDDCAVLAEGLCEAVRMAGAPVPAGMLELAAHYRKAADVESALDK